MERYVSILAILVAMGMSGCGGAKTVPEQNGVSTWGHTGVIYEGRMSGGGRGGGGAAAVVGFEVHPRSGLGAGIEAAGYSGG